MAEAKVKNSGCVVMKSSLAQLCQAGIQAA